MNMVLPFTEPGLVLAVMVSALSPSWGRAQPAVREWPDPGYRRLGVYGSGPDSYFDCQLVKLRLGDNFPDKKAYWAGLRSNAERRNASHRHNIYFVYCGERKETLETCKARVDAWLAPEADLPTHPELIPAICMEFDVSCAVFSVAGPGAMNPWLSSRTPDMIRLRNCLRAKRQQMHALAADDLPLATAGFSARDRSIPVGGDADSPTVMEISFMKTIFPPRGGVTSAR
jgi:hypothetical protein